MAILTRIARAPDPHALVVGMVKDPLGSFYWPAAKAMLGPALDRSDEDWTDVEPDLVSNAKQLWAVLDGETLVGAAVTRVALTRTGEVAEVYLVGGVGFRRWLAKLNNTIEASAREIGCVGMRAYGRVGWKKPLEQLGWRPRHIAYEKRL